MFNETHVVTVAGTDLVLGVVSSRPHNNGTWRFMPMVAGRRSSSKNWPTKEQAIPRWCKKYDLHEKQPNQGIYEAVKQGHSA